MRARAGWILGAAALAACGGKGVTSDAGASKGDAADGAAAPEPAGLEWLAAPAPDETSAARVSADGQVVVGRVGRAGLGQSHFQESAQAFRWTRAGGLVGVGAPFGLAYSEASALTADGATIFGLATDQALVARPFRWTSAGVEEVIGIDAVVDTSADGAVLIGSLANHPARAVAGAGTPLLSPPPESANVTAVSADGKTIVGRMTIAGPPQADVGFVWTATGVSQIGGPSAYTEARDVSDDGATVVGFDYLVSPQGEGTASAFRRTAAGKTTLGPFMPYKCSADAGVVVGFWTIPVPDGGVGDPPPRARVWDEAHGVRDLGEALAAAGVATDGAVLENAFDVSADGRVIVGEGHRAGDLTLRAFRAVLPR